MGTHPIFESDFDCLTEIGMMNCEGDHEIFCMNFNQDGSSLSAGCKSGFYLYGLSNATEKLDDHFDASAQDVMLVERLFNSSLVVTVSQSNARKIRVYHFRKGSMILQHTYPSAVLSVKMNRLRLVVCLEESLYIHNIRDMSILHTIRDTPPNPRGVCALAATDADDSCGYLAYPGSPIAGELNIFDTVNLRAVTQLNAHDNPIAAVALDKTGTKVATASDKGTVIRIFAVPSGKRLYEFRRGVARCAVISSLSFSSDAMFLAVSSNTQTIHVFKLGMEHAQVQVKEEENKDWGSYLSRSLQSAASYLPSGVSEVLQQGRDFATAKLHSCGLKNISVISDVNRKPRLFVACSDGYLYVYDIDANGGECNLLKQHKLCVPDLSDPHHDDAPPMIHTVES